MSVPDFHSLIKSNKSSILENKVESTPDFDSLVKSKRLEKKNKKKTEVWGNEGADKLNKFLSSEQGPGSLAALATKTGGFAGSPTATTAQAKKIGIEVAKAGALEGIAAAFAPIYGAAAGAEIAPNLLTSLISLTQAGTSGVALSSGEKLLEEGQLPSKEELVKNGLQWVVLDGILQAAHLSGSFGLAINRIAKKEGIPPSKVLSKLWDSTKNYMKSKFGKSIDTPQDVTEPVVEVLMKEAEEQAAKEVETIIPKEPISSSEDYIPKPRTSEQVKDVKVLNERPMSKNMLGENNKVYPFENSVQFGKAIHDQVKAIDKPLYTKASELYRTSKKVNSGITQKPVKLASDLQDIKENTSTNSPEISKRADSILKKISTTDPEGNITGYKEISNQNLIDEIQKLREDFKYHGMHGEAQNKKLNIISALNNAVEFGARDHPTALKSIKEARKAYGNWAKEFKSPYIRHLRDQTNYDYNKTFNESLDFDQFNVLKETLSKSPKGRLIVNQLKNQIVRKELSSITRNLDNIDENSLNERLQHLGGVIPPHEIKEVKKLLFLESEFLKTELQHMKFQQEILKKQKDEAEKALKQKEKTVLKFLYRTVTSGRPVKAIIKIIGALLYRLLKKYDKNLTESKFGKILLDLEKEGK